MARPGLHQHRKFLRLVRSLGSAPLARGVLEMLWEPAYDAGDDHLGDAEDIAARCGIDDPQMIEAALLEAGGPGGVGFIESCGEESHGVCYRIHDLFDHAPTVVGRRVKKELERTDRGITTRKLLSEAGKKRAAVAQRGGAGRFQPQKEAGPASDQPHQPPTSLRPASHQPPPASIEAGPASIQPEAGTRAARSSTRAAVHAQRAAGHNPKNQPHPDQPDPFADSADDIAAVFEHYRATFKTVPLVVSPAQQDMIAARLREGYAADELKRAITGLSRSDWHMRKGQVTLAAALQDGERVENCWRWLEHPPDQELRTNGRASEADRDWNRPIAVDANGEAVL